MQHTGHEGVRMRFRNNIVQSASHRTFKENMDACYQAIAVLEGISMEQLKKEMEHEPFTIEVYTSH